MKIMIKRFALRYNGREYKQGTVVNLPDEIAQKLVRESKGDFEEINEIIIENEPEPAKTPKRDGKDVKKEPENEPEPAKASKRDGKDVKKEPEKQSDEQGEAEEPEDGQEDKNDSEELDDRQEDPEEADTAELPKTNLAQTVKNGRARK